jgi:O-antigen ligase
LEQGHKKTRALSQGFGPQGFALFIIGAAILLGLAVVRQSWLFIAAVLVLPFLLRWPVRLSLGLYALLIPLEPLTIVGKGHTGTTLTWVLGLVAGFILLAVGILSDRLQLPPRATLWWWLFVGWASATSLWAIDSQASLKHLPTLLSLLLFYSAAACFRIREEELSWVAKLAIVGGVAASTVTCFQWLHDPADLRGALVRGNAETDPNYFASSLLVPLSLSLGAFLSARGQTRKVTTLAAVAIIGFGVLLTMSRGGLVAAMAVIVCYLFRYRLRWRTSLPLLVLAALVLVLPEHFFTRMQLAFTDRGAGRFDIWDIGLVALTHGHYGFIGAGLDNFPMAFQQFISLAQVFPGYDKEAHNTYLSVAVELGMVGFTFFAAGLIAQFHAIRRWRKRAGLTLVPYEAAMVGILVAAISIDMQRRKSFWFACILLAMATNVLRDRGNANGDSEVHLKETAQDETPLVLR